MQTLTLIAGPVWLIAAIASYALYRWF
jgi:hypothetical protein